MPNIRTTLLPDILALVKMEQILNIVFTVLKKATHSVVGTLGTGIFPSTKKGAETNSIHRSTLASQSTI